MSDAAAQAWRSLAGTTTLLAAELERQTQRDAGMPNAYYGMLAQLYEAPEHRLRMSELAGRAGISRSRLTHAVTSMERSGWVARTPDAADGRGQLVTMTDAGLAVIRRFAPRQVERLRIPALAGLDDAELAQLAALLDRVAGNLRSAGDRGAGPRPKTGPATDRGSRQRGVSSP